MNATTSAYARSSRLPGALPGMVVLMKVNSGASVSSRHRSRNAFPVSYRPVGILPLVAPAHLAE